MDREVVLEQGFEREPLVEPQAVEHDGTWWEHWAGWINTRSGPLRAAPSELGSQANPPLVAAPGTYVHMVAAS
jgi:poly(3-hydroxyalkanoate) synthetase